MNLCTKLFDRVLSLEQIKTNQAVEIKKLKKRVKKLKGKKKKKKRTHGLKRMYKVALSAKIVSSDEEAGENVEQDATVVEKEVSTADPVTTTGEVITTAEGVECTTATTTLQISKDDVALAQTLIEIKAAKPRARGKDQIALDEEDSRQLEAQMKAKMEEEEMIAREKDEANIAMIAQWDEV
nr:hypothetical protein [Tanacetum cinerariifolium]